MDDRENFIKKKKRTRLSIYLCLKFKIQRIRGDVEELYKPGASLFGQSVRRPIANARAMNVYRYAVLVRSKNSLHFVFAEGVQEIGEAKGSILD